MLTEEGITNLSVLPRPSACAWYSRYEWSHFNNRSLWLDGTMENIDYWHTISPVCFSRLFIFLTSLFPSRFRYLTLSETCFLLFIFLLLMLSLIKWKECFCRWWCLEIKLWIITRHLDKVQSSCMKSWVLLFVYKHVVCKHMILLFVCLFTWWPGVGQITESQVLKVAIIQAGAIS